MLSREPRALLTAAAAAALLLGFQMAPLPLAVTSALGFLLCAWRWPSAGLIAVILALPFHRVLRPVTAGWGFSAAEVGIVLCVAAAGLRLAYHLVRGSSTTALCGLTERPSFLRLRQCRRGTLRARRSQAKRQLSLFDHRCKSGRLDAEPGPSRASGASFRKPADLTSLLARLDAFDVAALAFVALGLLSLAVSIKPWESTRVLRTVVLEPVALYFVVTRTSGTRTEGRRLADAVVVSAALISLVGLYQYAVNQNIITAEESLRRIRGFYGSPNHLGLFLGRAVPIAVCLFAFQPRRRPAYLLALGLTGAALVLTFSVGAWAGVLAAVVFVAALRGRRALARTLAGLAALALAAAPILLGIERFRSHLDFGEGTSYLRLQVWLSSLAIVRDHPLLGIGLDNFLYYYRDLGYRLPGGWREPDLSHPHNLLLDFWLSLGLAGLAWLLLVLPRYFGSALAAFRVERDRAERDRNERERWAGALALGLMASMLDFVVHGLIDNSYFLPDLAVLFWLSFAIVRVLRTSAPPRGTARADLG